MTALVNSSGRSIHWIRCAASSVTCSASPVIALRMSSPCSAVVEKGVPPHREALGRARSRRGRGPRRRGCLCAWSIVRGSPRSRRHSPGRGRVDHFPHAPRPPAGRIHGIPGVNQRSQRVGPGNNGHALRARGLGPAVPDIGRPHLRRRVGKHGPSDALAMMGPASACPSCHPWRARTNAPFRYPAHRECPPHPRPVRRSCRAPAVRRLRQWPR